MDNCTSMDASNSSKIENECALEKSEEVNVQHGNQEKERDIVKIYPTANDLTIVNNSIICPEKSCSSTFNSESNLRLHLSKTHKRENLLKNDKIKQYHCPSETCPHHKNQSFKALKLLKQHYLRLHSPKDYLCSKCNKGFPTESAKGAHQDYCGIDFRCTECDSYYASYEALQTHSRRKKHKILEKIAYKVNANPIYISKSAVALPTMGLRILPKPSPSLQVMPGVNTSDQSIQTDVHFGKLRSRNSLVNRKGRKSTQETQTYLKRLQLTVQTQTIGDYFNKKSNLLNDVSKSIKTQTSEVASKTNACNTTLGMGDFDFSSPRANVQRSSSGTQTMIKNDEVLASPIVLDNFDSNFFNNHIETQTDFMLDEDMFNCEYYTNMYTQTCEEISDETLFSNLEFSNIETQTVDEVLRSVESQTMTVSHNKKTQLSCRDMTHMETQTDLEYAKMLEEINA